MELCVNLDLMHFLPRIILKGSRVKSKRSSQPCEVGVKVGLSAGFGSFASVPNLAGKLPYKCQVLGMVREVRFGTSPSCIFGLASPNSSWNSLPVSC